MPKPKPTRGHRWSSRPKAPAPALLLLPVLEQLADDTWLLARKSPALPADPALVEAAGRLLATLRRLLRREPDFALLPRAFAPGISLHALALGLRQLQVGLARLAARHAPRTSEDDLDATLRLSAHFLRDITVRALEQRDIPLPPDLRRVQTPGNQQSGRVAEKVIPASAPPS
jgi:hypothetical protein